MLRTAILPHMQRCWDGGYLVPASGWLPGVISDRHFLRSGPPIGCSRLECSRCGAPVRSLPGHRPSLHATAAMTWEQPERAARPDPTGRGRLYACRCALAAIHAEQRAGSADGPAGDLSLWRCAGHPPLTLPAAVDGVLVSGDTDFGALARAYFTGAIAAPVHPSLEVVEGFWLLRLHSALPEPARRALALAVNHLLLDDDPRVRAGALRFFCRLD